MDLDSGTFFAVYHEASYLTALSLLYFLNGILPLYGFVALNEVIYVKHLEQCCTQDKQSFVLNQNILQDKLVI